MVIWLPPVTLAVSTTGLWPSVSVCRWEASVPRALPARSSSCIRFMSMVPVSSVATGSPVNVITCVASAAPVGPVAGRVPAWSRARPEYAAATLATASLYVMVIWLPPVTLADSTLGGIPSPIGSAETASSSLPAASRTTDSTLRRYVMSATGLVPVRFEASVSTSSVDPADMSDLDDTAGLPAPDTDQPPAPSVPDALTGSSNAMRIVPSDVAVALETEGACPSASVRFTTPAPNGLPSRSTTAGPSIKIQPVALGAASSLPNATVCVRVPFQSCCACNAVRISPSTKIDW